MQKDKLILLTMCDALMSEYSWTLEYVLSIPHDIIKNLYALIIERKQAEYGLLAKIIAVGTNAGFTGKMDAVNKMFKKTGSDAEGASAETQIEQMRQMWMKLHPKKNVKVFDRQVKEGNVKF